MPADMRALKRQSGKNYIGVVSEKFEEQCAVELRANSDQLVKSYLLRLMAVVRNRRVGAS